MAPALPSLMPRRAVLAMPFLGCASGKARGQPTPLGPASPGLAARARRCNRFFGSAIDRGQLETEASYMSQVATECGILVGENQFKWGALRPKADAFAFAQADALVAWATRNAMQVRGHALLWHNDNPPWLLETLTQGNAEKLLSTHVRTVVRHFRNKLVHWDVTNEVIWVRDKQMGGYRASPWYNAMGAYMMDVAFHACAEADPVPLRFMNEDQIEYAWDEHTRKRAAILEQLAALKARNVPVQALGIQAHLEAGVKELDQNALSKFVADVASLGIQVAITEMDVRDNRLGGDIPSRDAEVAAHARAYLDAVLPNPAVMGVLCWGMADSRTWLNDEIPREDKLPQRALPLDAELKRKPLYDVIGAAFDAAPVR